MSGATQQAGRPFLSKQSRERRLFFVSNASFLRVLRYICVEIQSMKALMKLSVTDSLRGREVLHLFAFVIDSLTPHTTVSGSLPNTVMQVHLFFFLNMA